MLNSQFRKLFTVTFPTFSGTRIMMMPIVIGDPLPDSIAQYNELMSKLVLVSGDHVGKVGYLTIDEREVAAGETHRRPGLHVDGVSKANDAHLKALNVELADRIRALEAELAAPRATKSKVERLERALEEAKRTQVVYRESYGHVGYGSRTHGMLLVASAPGCDLYSGTFDVEPDDDGGCEHLRSALPAVTPMAPGLVHWLSGECVHESTPMPVTTRRQFLRLSPPTGAPWHDGYTENPLGVKPTGPVLGRREWMTAA